MALHSTEAFVLRTYSLAEAHKICVFFTKESGKMRGVAHGARKMNSRFGSALEPFTQVALTYHHKEGRELVSLSTCDILSSNFYSAARDVSTSSAFSYMAELMMEFLPDNEPNGKLYRLVAASLESIKVGCDLAHILRYFEAWTLRLVGFFPDLSHCAVCGEAIGDQELVFLTSEGAPRCATCGGARGTQANSELRSSIRRIFSMHPSAFAKTAVSHADLEQMGEINYQIIRSALERDLKSRPLLKQLSSV
jgi:DNA repair protein RecO (recombination protein O)